MHVGWSSIVHLWEWKPLTQGRCHTTGGSPTFGRLLPPTAGPHCCTPFWLQDFLTLMNCFSLEAKGCGRKEEGIKAPSLGLVAPANIEIGPNIGSKMGINYRKLVKCQKSEDHTFGETKWKESYGEIIWEVGFKWWRTKSGMTHRVSLGQGSQVDHWLKDRSTAPILNKTSVSQLMSPLGKKLVKHNPQVRWTLPIQTAILRTPWDYACREKSSPSLPV